MLGALGARLGGSGPRPHAIREAVLVPCLHINDHKGSESVSEAVVIPSPGEHCLLLNKANGAFVPHSQVVMLTTSKKQSEYYSNIYLSTKLTFQGLCP